MHLRGVINNGDYVLLLRMFQLICSQLSNFINDEGVNVKVPGICLGKSPIFLGNIKLFIKTFYIL